MRVVFKNLENSEFVRDQAVEKIEHILDKFPELVNPTVSLMVSMENSQFHAGRELYKVKAVLKSRGLKPLVVEKEAENPYQAIAILTDRLLEAIHRTLEKRREKSRSERRGLAESSGQTHDGRRAG